MYSKRTNSKIRTNLQDYEILKEKFREFGMMQGLWNPNPILRRSSNRIPGTGFFRYCENILFKDVDLKGKSLLDVGCGDGLYMIWAAINGANPIVGIEPISEGSGTSKKTQGIFPLAIEFLKVSNMERLFCKLQDFECQPKMFDVVLMASSINHLDEQMCMELRNNSKAKEVYLNMFKKIRAIMKSEGKLIVTDCSNRNIWGDMGLKNVLASNINWAKHQSPKYWADLFLSAGFSNPKITWGVDYRLCYRGIYKVPWFISYLLTSSFRLEVSVK